MVEAVELLDLVAERAAHDQPHDQLDALRARFAQILDMRHLAQGLGVLDQLLDEVEVELLVDQPGAGALELVAHAAGAPDLHVDVFREALDSRLDAFAEAEAAVARRRRVGDHVDRERDDLARPGLRFAVDHAQRHGAAVVDVHLVHDGHVELVEDQALGDVPGEVRMADHVGHRARAPAFVGRLEHFRAADRESRDDVHVEGRCMVVIDQDHDVGRVARFLHPFADRRVAVEHRRPVIVVPGAGLHRSAERGDVARSDAGGNAGHVSSLS